MTNEQPSQPILVVRQGAAPNQIFELNKDVLTIGSTAENDIVIADAQVAPHHAIITRKGDDWLLEDLGSRFGTWVNGKRISKETILRQGARISFGPNVILAAEIEPAGAVQPVKKGGCGKTAVLVTAGLALLVVLIGSAALGYYYLYPRQSVSQATFEALPNLGLAVTIQEPSPGAEVAVGSTFLVFVTARDEKGVTRIDLWVDDRVAITQSSPDPNGLTPFSLIHEMLAEKAGSHVLVAHAFNREGDMGASPAIVVTVSDEEQAAENTAIYIAEEGDTLESIANKSGNTVGAIQNANPGIKSVVQKGKKVNIPNPPHPPLPKPPAQPGGGIDWLPGVVPGWKEAGVQALPGALPGQEAGQLLPGLVPGQNVWQILPKALPDMGSIANPPNATVKAPDGLQASVKDCTVTLTWKDNADNNTEYQVFRRLDGEPGLKQIAVKNANAETHADTVEGPGKYTYIVGAINSKGPADKNGWSSYVTAEVKPTDNCKIIPTFKQVIFHPVSFAPSDGMYVRGFLNVGLGNMIPIRIPAPQQDNFAVGALDASYKRVFPLPVELYIDSTGKLAISISGNGVTGDQKVFSLGMSRVSYPISELISPEARKLLRRDTEADGAYSIAYYLWIEDWKWTGQGTTDFYPAPTNLRLSADYQQFKKLEWDYDPNFIDQIDGFIVYRQYSCPGEAALLKFPTMVEKTSRILQTTLPSEPPGCSCKFQVSAIGGLGESKLSDPPKERCQTRPSNYGLEVTFQNLRIDRKTLPQTVTSEVYLFANEFKRKSERSLLEAKNYDLKDMTLDGSPANNKINLSLAEDESIHLSFYVSDLCKSLDQSVKKPGASWTGFNSTINLASADNGCSMAVQILDTGGGSQAPVGKEPAVYLGGGDRCSLNWECQSGICDSGRCVPNGDGVKGEYCHTNSHCESRFCTCPAGRDGKNCRDWENFTVSYRGACAEGKESGDRCSQDVECASGYCANGWRCAPKNGTGRLGDFCFHDNHCGSGTCFCALKGKEGGFCKEWDDGTIYSDPTIFGYCDEWAGPPNGAPCNDGGDCKSNACANGVCAPRNGSGLAGDYCHHNDHCFSGNCQCGQGESKDIWGICKQANSSSIGTDGLCQP